MYTYVVRFAIYIALCLCIGTVFYDIGSTYDPIQVTATFVADNTISSVPYLILVSTVPGAIAYYLVGLRRSTDHLAYFTLLLFTCMMLVESLMLVVAATVPDFLIGIIVGVQGIMILNDDFFRLPDDIPKPFWKFPVYYVSFQYYANEGLYKNEFEGLVLLDGQSGQATGAEILGRVWEMEMGCSKWVDLGLIVGMVVVYRLLFWGIIMAPEKVKPMNRALL
ncbi:hypothetical protein OROMI_030927 [Orobanche minor]